MFHLNSSLLSYFPLSCALGKKVLCPENCLRACVSVALPIWAQNHRSVRKASCVSLAVWVLALILSMPYFIFRDTAPSYVSEDIIRCFNNYALSDDYETPSVNLLRQFRHQAMTITRFLLGFVVPFTVIVSCYTVIIYHLRRNHTLANQSHCPLKIFTAAITTFFVCCAPYHTMIFIELIRNIVAVDEPICLNPILYVLMSQGFKNEVYRAIVKVLKCPTKEQVACP